MSSTDSDVVEKVVGMPSEPVVDLTRNEWTASIGIGGRHGPDYALVNLTWYQVTESLHLQRLQVLFQLRGRQTPRIEDSF